MIRRYLGAGCASCALHLLAAAILAWDLIPGRTRATVTAVPSIAAFVVARAEDPAYPGLNPVEAGLREWTFPADDRSAPLRLGDLRIDVAKIGSRALVLFPFLTPGLSLEHYLITPQRGVMSQLQNPLARTRARRLDPKMDRPLELTDRALQSLIDRSWARRDRWAAFEPIGRLAETHSPDEGRLPHLLRNYVDQNALQPYTDVTERDPRLWAQLGLAADHVSFIGFVRRYAADHPSTKATTELLFLLDRVAEASRDALAVLLDTDPAERLAWTHTANAGAYNLVTRIRRFYQHEVARRGLASEEAITAYYEQVRLEILNGIVRSTPGGYRADDARFLIGSIYWRQKRTDEALRAWAGMTDDAAGGHAPGTFELAAALRGRSPVQGAGAAASLDDPLRREIEQILKNEHSRWVDFSYERLRRFGYRFDSF